MSAKPSAPAKPWVCVFCASAAGASAIYLQAAQEMGRLTAGRGYGLLYGGAAVGAIPDVIREREIDHKGLTELHVVRTMHERKALLASRADAFVALPGGYGTLDEFIEVVTWAQLRIHAKPCVMVNVGGYYDALLTFFDTAVEEGLIKPENRGLVQVARDASEALEI